MFSQVFVCLPGWGVGFPACITGHMTGGFGIPLGSAYGGGHWVDPLQDTWDTTGYSQQRSAGVTPEVNLGECTSRIPPPSANKAVHSGLKPRGDVTKSSKRVSVSTPI